MVVSDMLTLEPVEPVLPILVMSLMSPTQAGSSATAKHSLHDHLKLNSWHDCSEMCTNQLPSSLQVCEGPCGEASAGK